jgi:hypothetical protein
VSQGAWGQRGVIRFGTTRPSAPPKHDACQVLPRAAAGAWAAARNLPWPGAPSHSHRAFVQRGSASECCRQLAVRPPGGALVGSSWRGLGRRPVTAGVRLEIACWPVCRSGRMGAFSTMSAPRRTETSGRWRVGGFDPERPFPQIVGSGCQRLEVRLVLDFWVDNA